MKGLRVKYYKYEFSILEVTLLSAMSVWSLLCCFNLLLQLFYCSCARPKQQAIHHATLLAEHQIWLLLGIVWQSDIVQPKLKVLGQLSMTVCLTLF